MSLEKILGRGRSALVLMHPTSLPDPAGMALGIGELGSEAYRFVDFLVDAGVLVWQVLPLGHTGFMNSPYQTFSRYAGSPYLLSVEKLVEAGDLSPAQQEAYTESVLKAEISPMDADFGWLFENKLGASRENDSAILRLAFANFVGRKPGDPRRDAFDAFCNEHERGEFSWLNDYAEYMALKEIHAHRSWSEWPGHFRDVHTFRAEREAWIRKTPGLGQTIFFYQYLQFCFFQQWHELKNYAAEKGRLFLGDCPWYVGYDSADVWANPMVFDLDEASRPRHVAGVPPDYFSTTGQLWGNPLYNWKNPDAWEWWLKSIEFTLYRVDVLRLDHFRAIDTYWKIPFDWAEKQKTAEKGCWGKGPGYDLLKALQDRLRQKGRTRQSGQLPIVAEDLGGLDPLYAREEDYPTDCAEGMQFEVDEDFQYVMEEESSSLQPAFNTETGEYSTRVGVDYLLSEFSLPWMSVAQFGYQGSERHDPRQVSYNCVMYTGTHDNDTALGWYLEETRRMMDAARHRFELRCQEEEVHHVEHQEDGDVVDAASGELLEMEDILGGTIPVCENPDPGRDVSWEMIGHCMESESGIAGAPLQDFLSLGPEARMNLPGDNSGWWTWRTTEHEVDWDDLAGRVRDLLEKYNRAQ